MDVKEKLVELLHKGVRCPGVIDNCNDCPYYSFEKACDEFGATVDLLIANGVTVPECGHWVSYQSDKLYGCMDDKEWYRCSKCGKDAHGRCYEDEWYSAPILSAYCPHCGAKMMPQPPKGE